jgi:hypothetical protein
VWVTYCKIKAIVRASGRHHIIRWNVVMPSREVTREDVVPPMETWWIAASSLKASADKQVVVGWVEREGGQGREEG